MNSIMTALFGSYSRKELKRIKPICNAVIDLEDQYRAMSDEELKAQTPAFKERLANGETLDDILPEAFAVCREASDRVLGMRHFPVQILGGIVLHQGRIAEMKTGEGKTLVATLPAYLNGLSGEGRAHRYRERLPRPPRLRVDGQDLQVPRPFGRPDRPRPRQRRPQSSV